MAVIDEFVEANADYSREFDKGHLLMPPARRVAIVTCTDARIDPARALGLEEGDARRRIREEIGAEADDLDFLSGPGGDGR